MQFRFILVSNCTYIIDNHQEISLNYTNFSGISRGNYVDPYL